MRQDEQIALRVQRTHKTCHSITQRRQRLWRFLMVTATRCIHGNACAHDEPFLPPQFAPTQTEPEHAECALAESSHKCIVNLSIGPQNCQSFLYIHCHLHTNETLVAHPKTPEKKKKPRVFNYTRVLLHLPAPYLKRT